MPYARPVPRPNCIELGRGRSLTRIPILYEDRSVIAIDKPAGWLLIPVSWQRTQRNLQAALLSSIAAGDHWARSRNLSFFRYVHRLDAETTGILMFGKSPGAVRSYGDLFESRRMLKTYLAIVRGVPTSSEWTCRAPIGRHPRQLGRMRVDPRFGKEAETQFRVLQAAGDRALIEAKPVTGRTHQIRVHLLEAGHPVVGDDLYGSSAIAPTSERVGHPCFPLALRATALAYTDPFQKRRVEIEAPADAFLGAYQFNSANASAG